MLASYTYTHNCIKIDYPVVESIQSSLLVADRVFVCDCDSTDGTLETLQAMAKTDNRIQVMQHPWGDHFRIQGQICNGMLSRIESEGYDYALQVQADEIVCEWTIARFRNELKSGLNHGAPKYRHFCPDYRTTWPFIYERKTVLTSCKKKMRYGPDSDACSVAVGQINAVSLELHHVGKVQLGRERQALVKEMTHQEMYKSIGFPDPKFVAMQEGGIVDYPKAFEGVVFSPYRGPHPSVLIPRIMRAEGNHAPTSV